MIELRRSDIGFGRVVVDESGVSRHRLFSRQQIRWEEIESYRLSLDLLGTTPTVERLYGGGLGAFLGDLSSAGRGEHTSRFSMKLRGARGSVFFNWRFKDVERAIAAVLARVHESFTARAREELGRTGVARFGSLSLSRDGIGWEGRSGLSRRQVERLDIFNSSPVTLRLLKHDKAWPYARAPLDHFPNVMSALAIADELGYPLAGRELLRAITPTPPL